MLFTSSSVVAIVIALGFSIGLNVYATMLALGIMARMHWAVLPPGLEMLANGWVMVASGVLFAGGFVADKIPGVDVVWNLLHTFVRIPSAALISYAAGSHLSPELRALVAVVGAAVAAVAHGSKTSARVMVSASPEPVSNIALSTTEDGAAVGLSWLAMHHPAAAGILATLATLAALGGMWWMARKVAGVVRRWRAKQKWFSWRPASRADSTSEGNLTH